MSGRTIEEDLVGPHGVWFIDFLMGGEVQLRLMDKGIYALSYCTVIHQRADPTSRRCGGAAVCAHTHFFNRVLIFFWFSKYQTIKIKRTWVRGDGNPNPESGNQQQRTKPPEANPPTNTTKVPTSVPALFFTAAVHHATPTSRTRDPRQNPDPKEDDDQSLFLERRGTTPTIATNPSKPRKEARLAQKTCAR